MDHNNSWQVLKFGGTSVSSKINWDNIVAIVKHKLAKNKKLFIVHSALSQVSNRLEALVALAETGDKAAYKKLLEQIVQQHQDLVGDLSVDAELLSENYQYLRDLSDGIYLLGEASDKSKAKVMAQGELWATKIGHAYLQLQVSGHQTLWLEASKTLKVIDEQQQSYLAANCVFAPDSKLQEQVSSYDLVITQGFIAANNEGDILLLGRGGSDTSAAYFSSKLEAENLEIWTDVEGVFSANPQQVENARLLTHLSYQELQEMASAGAKIIHPRTIKPLRQNNIPLYIRSTLSPELAGTEVNQGQSTVGMVKAINAKRGVTLISMEAMNMWQQAGFLSDLFTIYKKHQVSVDLVSTSETNVTVTLDSLTQTLNPKQIGQLVADLSRVCQVAVFNECAAVSIVGQNVRSSLHKIAPALSIFESYKVYLMSQSASDLNLTFVVDNEHCDKVIASLHETLISNNPNSQQLGPTISELRKLHASEETNYWWQSKLPAIHDLMQQQDSAYLYDLSVVANNAQELKSISAVDEVFYAVKANNNLQILDTIYKQGINFEAVSVDEIRLIRKQFQQNDYRIFFTPNFAAKKEYQEALSYEVTLCLDSSYPLQHWPEVFAGKEIFLRIDPNVGKGHHQFVKTAGASSKFGIPQSELEQLIPILAKHQIEVIGLHAHAGSGILNNDHWAEHAQFLVTLASQFSGVKYLNLGGGFGIKEREQQTALTMKLVDQHLQQVKKDHPEYEFWIEPGRFMVANAGVLLAKTTQVKQKDNYYYVGLNTGMNSLMRPALYGSYHPVFNLSKFEQAKDKLATIVGPICESTDKLAIEIPFPVTEEGDLVLIDNAGAYGHVMSNHYNLRTPAKEFCLEV